MARNAKPAIKPVGPEFNAQAPEEGRREQALVAQRAADLVEVDEQFGIAGVPYDAERYIAHAQGIVASMGSQAFELGRILLTLKEHCDAGGFSAAVQRIGVAPRFAQKCMQAAVKFQGEAGRELIASRLNNAQLLELVSEDDGDIETLAKGGKIAGLTIDDIERMTSRQLREALRNERREREEERSAFEQQIDRKDKKANRLERDLKRLERSELRVQADALLQEVDATIVDIMSMHTVLTDGVRALHQLYREARAKPDADVHQRLEHGAELIEKQLQVIQRAFGGK